MHLIPSFAAIALYALAAILLARPLLLRDRSQPRRALVLGLGAGAVAAHAVSALTTIYTPHGMDLGFYRVSSLIFWFISLIALLGSLRRPLHNLLAALFPLAALSIVVATLVRGPDTPVTQLDAGMSSHILLSILAYSVLTIAALQAAALGLQQHQLKQHHLRGIIQTLPPLQTMESMLFELIWIGVILLSLSILTGVIYIDNLFAQHLVHKTALSIVAWLIFATLLAGRHAFGWRSNTAVRWTLGGFVALMLAYFGSKLVLELILQIRMG